MVKITTKKEVKQNDLGKMSCFEEDIIKACKENEGKIISVDVAESEKDGKTWRNIRGFYEVVSQATESIEAAGDTFQEQEVQEHVEVVKMNKPMRKEFDKDPIGLAVDVFCAIFPDKREQDYNTQINNMKCACDIVSAAQKYFK